MPDRSTRPPGSPTAPRRRAAVRAAGGALAIAAGLALTLGATPSALAGTPAMAAMTAISPTGLAALALFAMSCVLVALEEPLRLAKSKPAMLAAALIWALVAWSARGDATAAVPVADAFRQVFLDYSELFFFLVVSMAFVEAMAERGVFAALCAALARRGWSYRRLFWATGLLAFALSSVLNNLTTALVVGAVALASNGGSTRFIALACVNIVVAANAGGAWSAFGDVTTLMVWQAGHAGFFEFFRLFVPALVNWLLPAVLMSLAVPAGRPPAQAATATLQRGGIAIAGLFAATIAATVASVQWLALPAVYGMLAGLAFLQGLAWWIGPRSRPAHSAAGDDTGQGFDIFRILASAEWDTLLFFGGVLLSVGGLAFLGWLELASTQLYGQFGATAANVALGVASAVIDNVPIMSAVLQMQPTMDHEQWLLIALTCGVGGSLLSIGSAAGVALMGVARGQYTFLSHLRWSWAIALGYAASVAVHLWLAPVFTAP